jgi:hypothetical protein
MPIYAMACLLAACGAEAPFVNVPAFEAPQVDRDAQGRCFGHDISPAVIETVTEHVLVEPAELNPDGTVKSPAVYSTVTRQVIVRERSEILFETICPERLTPEFVGSLQRALKIRGYYAGPISGRYDAATADAVRALQRQTGHDSLLLDIRTARTLGLVELTDAELGLAPPQDG